MLTLQNLNINFTPFPTLSTNLLELRRFTKEDEHDYFMMRNDEKIMEALDKEPNSLEETVKLMIDMEKRINNNEAIYWVICKKEDKKLLGYISFHHIDVSQKYAEIGYALSVEQHRKGIMQEAINAVLNYGFDILQLKYIIANVNVKNIPSQKLLLKSGFVIKSISKKLVLKKVVDFYLCTLENKNKNIK